MDSIDGGSVYRKAWTAAALAGLATALAFAIPIVDDGLTVSEGLGILLAFLTGGGLTGGATAAVRNGPSGDPRMSAPYDPSLTR